MRPFPENFQLESFFEGEPEVLDKDVPWAYNELVFNVTAKNGNLKVKMVTGCELMDVIWKQGEHTVLKLELKGIRSLQVMDEKKYDTLVSSFRSEDVDDLKIKIRPVISITWGYDDQP